MMNRMSLHVVASRLAAAVALGLVATASVHCPAPVDPVDAPEDPIARIILVDGLNQLALGDSVRFDGSSSSLGANTDGLGLELSYSWSLDARPIGSALVDEDLIVVDAEDPTLVELTPDTQGIFEVTLQVGDGVRVSELGHAWVQVGGGNTCPTADAGFDRTGATGIPIVLDGSDSADPDIADDDSGDDDDSASSEDPQTLDFAWTFSLVPSHSDLTDGDIFLQGTDHPSFIPDVPGTYILGLRVDDGLCRSEADYVTINVSDGDSPPTADAGRSILLTPCSPSEVTLDGTRSFDPEGHELRFMWSFVAVPNGSQVSDALIDGRTTSTPRFNWDVPGTYTLQVLVEAGEQQSQPAYVAVQAVPREPNGAPVADAGGNLVVDATANCVNDPYTGPSCSPCGERSVVIDGTDSEDPDADDLSYQWNLISGSATLLGTQAPTLELELPELAAPANQTVTATYELSLSVFDCAGASTDTVTVTYNCTGEVF